ncbi:MAG: hypothetical protein ACK463_18555, partial [Bradyrhizobium sp.]
HRGSRIGGCAAGCAGRPAVGSFRLAPHGTLPSDQSAAADAAADCSEDNVPCGACLKLPTAGRPAQPAAHPAMRLPR